MLLTFDILFCMVGLYGLLIFYNILFYLYFKNLEKKSYKIIKYYYEVDLNMFSIYIALSLGLFIFIYRLAKMTHSFDIYDFWDQLKVYWSMVDLISIIILIFVLLLFLMLGINTIRYFLEKLKISILTVHLYYLQFNAYFNFCNSCITFKVNLEMFTYRTLKKVINQELANKYSPIIENFIINLEKILFRYIIIYLYIFDSYCQFGRISKVFIILPWYFIYVMLRVFINYYWNIITDFENYDLSLEVYPLNKQKIQGKILILISISSYCLIIFMMLFANLFKENITILLLIIILAIGSWLYIFAIILWQLLTLDNYDYYIKDKKSLLGHLGYIFMVIGICYYLFCVRLARRGFSLNLNLIYDNLINFAWDQPFFALVILVIGIVMLLFFILIVQTVLLYVKRSLLSIYLYLCYYDSMRQANYKFINFLIKFDWFLVDWVRKYTGKNWVFYLTRAVWPIYKDILEQTLYRFLIPYLIIFDIYCQYGVISKIFIVLPWYFIYSIFRGLIFTFCDFNVIENWEKSEELYGLDINKVEE